MREAKLESPELNARLRQAGSEPPGEGAAWGRIDRAVHRDAVVSVPPCHAGFTSNDINHDGNHPIEGQKLSKYAEWTLPVRWEKTRREMPLLVPIPRPLQGAYQPNGFDLWQENGNVWEWCRSGWVDGTLKGPIAALENPEMNMQARM